MRVVALAALLCTVAPQALAQAGGSTTAAPTPPATLAAPPQGPVPARSEGVIVYRPDYFAEGRPNSAFDMIRRIPGFTFSGGDQVRGFAGAAGNVLIDGQRPASKNDALSDILGRIPASDVERIEVIRGGSTGMDMQGHTVVANVIRRTGAKTQGLVSLSANLFPDDQVAYSFRTEGSRRWNGRLLEGSLSGYTSVFNGDGADGYRNRRNPDGSVLFDSRVLGYGFGQGVGAKASYSTPVGRGTLRLNGSLAYDRPETEEVTVFLASGAADRVTYEQPQVGGELGLNYKRPLGPRTEAEGVLLQRLSAWDLETTSKSASSASLFTEDATSGESIARAVVRFRQSQRLTLETGGEVAYNVLDSATAFTQNGAPVALPNAQVKVEEQRAEVFGLGAWRISETLTLEAGSRFEVSKISQSGDSDSERSFFYPKPRAVLTWSPNRENQLRLRAERRVSQLNFGDFVASSAFSTDEVEAGNAELEPSKTWTYEAAYERRFWASGALVVTVSHQEITDAVDRVPIFSGTSVFDAVGNIGDGKADTLRIDVTVPLDRLFIPRGQLKAFGSWVDIDVTDPTTGERRRASGNSPFYGEIHFTQDLPRWKTTWGFDYNSPTRSTSFRFNEIRISDFDAWLSAFAEYKPTPLWALRIEAQNLLNRSLRRERFVYTGTRDQDVLLYREVRDVDFPPFLFVRVRRSFE